MLEYGWASPLNDHFLDLDSEEGWAESDKLDRELAADSETLRPLSPF
jgi:hypothetical protein